MFVGYATKGIDIYSIRDPENPKLIGTVDPSYLEDQRNGAGWGSGEATKLIFYDFNVKPMNFGFLNSNGENTLKKCPNCDSLYEINYT